MIIDFVKALSNLKNLGAKQDAVKRSLVEQTEFKANKDMTIGVETEFQLIDSETHAPVPFADDVQKIFSSSKNITPEASLSMVEIITSIQKDAHGVEKELGTLYEELNGIAMSLHAVPLANGCHPSVHYRNVQTRGDERYLDNVNRFQHVMRQWIACGMHIHIAMKSERECIRFMNFFRYFIPHFTALSASSPFWQGDDTGLHSNRAMLNEALPTASLLHSVKTWEDFQQQVKTLEVSGVIKHIKDLWWDLRPSCHYGTLELRMCDMPTNMQEMKAIVAFAHALAHWFETNGEWLVHMNPPKVWIARENKWRAIRHGLSADLIKDIDGSTTHMRTDIDQWLERITDSVTKLGYHDEMRTLRQMMAQGTAAERLRQRWQQTNDMHAVMNHCLAEFTSGKPVYVKPAAAETKAEIALLTEAKLSA